jgi:hypothetical protein
LAQELTKAFVSLGGDVQLMTEVCPDSGAGQDGCQNGGQCVETQEDEVSLINCWSVEYF